MIGGICCAIDLTDHDKGAGENLPLFVATQQTTFFAGFQPVC
jgi:hypothetical protein